MPKWVLNPALKPESAAAFSVPDFIIRPALVTDADAFRDLRLEALRNHPTAFAASYEEQADSPDDYWQDRLKSNVDNPANVLYFAVSDQTLVGMTGVYRSDSAKMRHTGHIWGVYVRPAWRKAGVARALISACLDWAKSQNLYDVKLAVVTTNADAIRCYVSSGFSVYGVEPAAIRYDGNYYDELLMARRL